jgi:8-oxo-dGTP pyrophosphatase MutT (NUDIX family)
MYHLIQRALSFYTPEINQAPKQGIPSAVLIPFFQKKGELYILFTKRTELVQYHKGEVSFPGGVRSKEDLNLLSTALRETEEELGVKPQDIKILGELEPYLTSTGFLIKPFVGYIPWPYPLSPNPKEIASLLEIPLLEILSKKEKEIIYRKGDELKKSICYQTERYQIWGATAFILKRLLTLIQRALK